MRAGLSPTKKRGGNSSSDGPLDRALRHVREIQQQYIAQDSPAAAQRGVDGFFEISRQLVQFPESGRVAGAWRDRPYRELLSGQYRLLYEVGKEAVNILAVIHAKRDLRALLTAWRRR